MNDGAESKRPIPQATDRTKRSNQRGCYMSTEATIFVVRSPMLVEIGQLAIGKRLLVSTELWSEPQIYRLVEFRMGG